MGPRREKLGWNSVPNFRSVKDFQLCMLETQLTYFSKACRFDLVATRASAAPTGGELLGLQDPVETGTRGWRGEQGSRWVGS